MYTLFIFIKNTFKQVRNVKNKTKRCPFKTSFLLGFWTTTHSLPRFRVNIVDDQTG